MVKKNAIKLFGDDMIRTVWDNDKEKWYFSIVDVVAVLTESADPPAYWRKLKQRLKAEGNETVTNCHGLKMRATDGKMRMTDVADTEQLLRIIQSIPSPKAEPFKMWLAKVGAERLDQMQDPELSIQQAMMDYKFLGYSDNWINQRLKSIEIEYKQFKGLKKENLRDNMTNEELVLNMLAELSATSITKAKNPQTLDENKQCAKEGGNVAMVARKELESKTGRQVISPLSAKRFFEAQKAKKKIGDKENNDDKEEK